MSNTEDQIRAEFDRARQDLNDRVTAAFNAVQIPGAASLEDLIITSLSMGQANARKEADALRSQLTAQEGREALLSEAVAWLQGYLLDTLRGAKYAELRGLIHRILERGLDEKPVRIAHPIPRSGADV